jgi:hypothetical protein
VTLVAARQALREMRLAIQIDRAVFKLVDSTHLPTW